MRWQPEHRGCILPSAAPGSSSAGWVCSSHQQPKSLLGLPLTACLIQDFKLPRAQLLGSQCGYRPWTDLSVLVVDGHQYPSKHHVPTCYNLLHFTDEETKGQGGQAAHPRSLREHVQNSNQSPRLHNLPSKWRALLSGERPALAQPAPPRNHLKPFTHFSSIVPI